MLIVIAPSPSCQAKGMVERVGACPPLEDEVRMEALGLICWIMKISSAWIKLIITFSVGPR